MSDDCCVPQGEEPFHTVVDYYMDVQGLPIRFVALLPALQRPWGPEFAQVAAKAAWLRAASTLGQMGLIRGPCFQFLRQGIPWLVSDVAAYLGVDAATVDAWEAETVPLPPSAWVSLADYVDRLDHRHTYGMGALAPTDLRPRVIRVYPDIPQQSMLPTVDLCGCGVE